MPHEPDAPTMSRPSPINGLHHVALRVTAFNECLKFYTELVGMQVEWQPDSDNAYLTSGSDNLALHRHNITNGDSDHGRLDHIGFILNTPEQVDQWHSYFVSQGITITHPPKTHRDGARSFYCLDPDNTTLQMIYHPPLCQNQAIPKE